MDASEKPTVPPYSIDSVDCALRVLKALCSARELRVSDVTERLGVAHSTAHRLLAMLVHHGFAKQDEPRGKYRPGPSILQIGFAATHRFDLRQYARPILEELRDQVTESVAFALPYGQHVFYVEGVESRRQLRVASRVGEFVPANCVALGKVLLAYLPQGDLHRLFPNQELPTLTKRSISQRDDLERHLEQVRARGYARSSSESDEDVGSIAVALTDPNGVPQAAMSVAAPLVRFGRKQEAAYLDALRSSATKLERIIWDTRVTA